MDGLLLVDKPEGWTSFDVVNYVRKIVATHEGKKPKHVKVGHTGTLDPAATGLLVLCIGKYTKKVPELIGHDKTYEAELTLGKTSTTGDREGELTNVSDMQPTEEAVLSALDKFHGEIEQLPPAFSALKIGGKKAYELARAGKPVELKPRKVTIYQMSDIEYVYPTVRFTVKVSSGTYIRSLAEDIGRELGTGAYLSSLRRTAVDDRLVGQALAVQDLSIEAVTDNLLAL